MQADRRAEGVSRSVVWIVCLIAFAAGCSSPESPGAATTAPTRSDPFAPTGGGPSVSIPSSGSTGGVGTTPGASPTPANTTGIPFTQSWRHEFTEGGKSLTVSVAPGYAPSDLLVGFEPPFQAGSFRCDGPDARVSLFAPSGDLVAAVRAGDLAVTGAGCPRAILIPDVGFVAGDWRIFFEGTGSIAAFLETGERVTSTNATLDHVETHAYAKPANTTLFVVPPHAGAVDLTIRLDPAGLESTCPGSEVRVVVRDPQDRIFARLELPTNPQPSDCAKVSTTQDVILMPGIWTVDWRGEGASLGTIEVKPRS